VRCSWASSRRRRRWSGTARATRTRRASVRARPWRASIALTRLLRPTRPLLTLALALTSTPLLAQGTASPLPAPHSGSTSALALGSSRKDANANGRDEVYIKSPGSSGGVTVATPTTLANAVSSPLDRLFEGYADVIELAFWSTGCGTTSASTRP